MAIGPGEYHLLQQALGNDARYLNYAGPLGILTRIERTISTEASDGVRIEEERALCEAALNAASDAAKYITERDELDFETKLNAVDVIAKSISGEHLAEIVTDKQQITGRHIAGYRAQLVMDRLRGPGTVDDTPQRILAGAPDSNDQRTGDPIKPTPELFIGSWTVGEFEFVVAADKSFASKMEQGHAGSFGKWAIVDGRDSNHYFTLDIATTYPVYVYGTQYTGNSNMGATKIEHPKKMALKIMAFSADRFSVEHDAAGAPLEFSRREKMAEPLLTVRIEELKSLLTIQEASAANNSATYNIQFGIAQDMQDGRWKQINSWRP